VPCTCHARATHVPAVDEEEVGRLDVAVRHPHAVQVRHRAVGLHDARQTERIISGAREASPSRLG